MISELEKKALEADFQEEALESFEYSQGLTLTSIKSGYVVERLNNVFGLGNWGVRVHTAEVVKDEILLSGVLLVRDWCSELFYGSQKLADYPSRGDAYNGAKTRILSKAASHIGVGNQVFKGNTDKSPRPGAGKDADAADAAMKFTEQNQVKPVEQIHASEDLGEVVEEIDNTFQPPPLEFEQEEQPEALGLVDKKPEHKKKEEPEGLTLKKIQEIETLNGKLNLLHTLGVCRERIALDTQMERVNPSRVDEWVMRFLGGEFQEPLDAKTDIERYNEWVESEKSKEVVTKGMRVLPHPGCSMQISGERYRFFVSNGIDDERYLQLSGDKTVSWCLTSDESVKMVDLATFCQWANEELIHKVKDWIKTNE